MPPVAAPSLTPPLVAPFTTTFPDSLAQAHTLPVHPSTPLTSCILDSGCTGHYIHVHTPHTDRQPANPSITVLLPNGSSIQSSHTATLSLHPNLPPSARLAHIFPTLTSGSLLSIGLLCDHGCVATFQTDSVTITLNDTLLMRGHHAPLTGL